MSYNKFLNYAPTIYSFGLQAKVRGGASRRKRPPPFPFIDLSFYFARVDTLRKQCYNFKKLFGGRDHVLEQAKTGNG